MSAHPHPRIFALLVVEPDEEWARRTNAETRRVMGVAIGPELSEYSPPPDKFHRARRRAQAYLGGLMSDEEAAACVAADLERVREILRPPVRDCRRWSLARRKRRRR